MLHGFINYGNFLKSTEQALYSCVPRIAINFNRPLIFNGEDPGLREVSVQDKNDGWNNNSLRNLNTLKNNILRSIAVLAVLFSLNSCETLELEILESPNALTPASSDIDFYLNAMQLNMASFFNGVKDEGMQLTRMSHLYGPFYENAFSTTQMSGPWNDAYSDIFTDIICITSFGTSE